LLTKGFVPLRASDAPNWQLQQWDFQEAIMNVWHIRFSSEERFVLFPDEQTRRAALRRLVKIAGNVMVLFCIVDEHIHEIVTCDHKRAGRIRQATHRSLQPMTSVKLEPSYIKEVENRRHLELLVRYVLTQVEHHALSNAHPALWSGSCFLDMIGARVLENLHLQLNRLLPRFKLRQAYSYVGLPQQEIRPLNNQGIRARGIGDLIGASSSVLAADPSLAGKMQPVVRARRAVVHLANQVGFSRADVGWALQISRRGIRSILQKQESESMLHAIRLHLALEAIVHNHGLGRGQGFNRGSGSERRDP
jgi:hypothetical protein